MMTLDHLIAEVTTAVPTLRTPTERDHHQKYLDWLMAVRDETSGEMRVGRLAVLAASMWVSPQDYAEWLKSRDAA